MLGSAKATYQAPCGSITSGWRYAEESVIYEIEIPVNTTATIVFPDGIVSKSLLVNIVLLNNYVV